MASIPVQGTPSSFFKACGADGMIRIQVPELSETRSWLCTPREACSLSHRFPTVSRG